MYVQKACPRRTEGPAARTESFLYVQSTPLDVQRAICTVRAAPLDVQKALCTVRTAHLDVQRALRTFALKHMLTCLFLA